MGKYKGELKWYWSKRVYVYPFKKVLEDFKWSEWRNISDADYENRLLEYNEVEAIGLKLVCGKKGICGIGIRRDSDNRHTLSVLQMSLGYLNLPKDYDWIVQTPHENIIIIDVMGGLNNKDLKKFENITVYWETAIQTPIRRLPTAYPVQFIGNDPQNHPKQLSKEIMYKGISQLVNNIDVILPGKRSLWKKVLIYISQVITLLLLFMLVGVLPVAGIPALIVFFWINWDKIFKKKREGRNNSPLP